MSADIKRQEMSTQLHEYVRHIVDCPDGHTRERLEAIANQIESEIGEYNPDILEDPVTHQRRLELSYVRGYLAGPGPGAIDINYDRQAEERHAAESAPKPRKKGRQ